MKLFEFLLTSCGMTKIGVNSVTSRMSGNEYILVDDFKKLIQGIKNMGTIGDASTKIEKMYSKSNVPDSESPYVKRFVTGWWWIMYYVSSKIVCVMNYTSQYDYYMCVVESGLSA